MTGKRKLVMFELSDTPDDGESCVNGAKGCGEPDGDGIASYCGKECWERAGSPELMQDEDR